MKRSLVAFIICAVVLMAVVAAKAEDKEFAGGAKDLFKQIQLFADSMTLINAEYVKPVKAKDLVYGAIRGMMNTLDKYSKFLDPESFQEITEETRGEFGGIGIEIGMRDEMLTVLAPMKDSPAFKAKLKAGDRIVELDGKTTKDMTLDDGVKIMRGDPGTVLKLTIVREGADDPIKVKIKRAVIKLKSIKDIEIIEEGIGYLRLAEFQERTANDLRREIKELKSKGVGSLIIDLRNNPGGLLDSSIKVADLFLPSETLIVYTQGRDPDKRTDFFAKQKAFYKDMDLVLIINKGSASASEILAGALMDNKRAVSVGEPTFGKGSVQTVIPLEDNSALRLTTAAYFTPSGKNLMNKGIDPDVRVEKIRIVKKKVKKKNKIKDEVFSKIIPPEDKASNKEQVEDKKMPEKYDNQIRAAVNILKGAKIFEEYRSMPQVTYDHSTVVKEDRSQE